MDTVKTKYEIPLDHLDYGYIEKCADGKEMEKIVKILRSGEEGRYPELEAAAEKKLLDLNPKSKVLLKDQPILSTRDLPKEDQKNIFEDIDCWSSDIKNFESGLKDTRNGLPSDDSLPPVRGSGNILFDKSSRDNQKTDTKSSKRVKPRDYREWDKIDVDAELEKIDKEEDIPEKKSTTSGGGLRSKPNIPETVPLGGLTDDEKRIKAEKEKDKGNEAFRSGDYSEAVLYYTRSLSLISNIAARNNRAQAYLKLEKWDKAISDVETVLSAEPNNVKAHLRRGVAYQGKRMFVEAKADIKKVLELEPNNKRAMTVLDEIESALKEQKVKGRRMVIEETDGSSDEEDSEESTKIDRLNTRKKPILESTEQLLIKDIEPKNNSIEKEKPVIEDITKEDNKPKVITSMESSKSSNQEHTEDQQVTVDSINKPENQSDKCTDNSNMKTSGKTESESTKENETSGKSKEHNDSTNDKDKTVKDMPILEPPPPLPAAVVKLKDAGNELFKAGRYADAITKYTNAINKIESDPRHGTSVSVLYSNRAACKHKTGDCHGCIEDSNRALVLNPGTIKPLLRRAMAYETLEKYRHAYVDFKQIVLIDHSAEIAQQGANRCQSILQQTDGPKWRDKLPAMSPMPATHVPTFPTLQQQSAEPTARSSDSSAKKPSVKTDINRNMSDAEKLDLFNTEKEKGNSFVKKGNFTAAITCYTRCIELCPEQSVAYTNRALCYLRTDQLSKVICDCDKALENDKNNVKALFRKAQAQKMLKQYKESRSLLNRVLILDKSNTAAKRELQVVQKYIMEEESKKKCEPRKKITIQEVSSDEESEEETQDVQNEKPVQPTVSSPKVNVKEEDQSANTPVDNTSPVQPSTKKSPLIESVTEMSTDKDNTDKSSANKKDKVTSPDTTRKTNTKKGKSETVEKENFIAYEKKASKASSKIKPTAGLMGANAGVKLDRATPFEFVSAWTALKTTHDIDQYLTLLEQVEPQKLPSVISNKLEGNMLTTIIKCVSKLIDTGKSGVGYGYLHYLTDVPRFEMNTMFMSTAEKKELKSVVDRLRQAKDYSFSKSELDQLSKKYGL